MTRYRKVEIGTWNDRRFRELSPQPPSGQTLWVYLLCGPRTTIFPGLVIATEAVIASDLRWPVSAELFDAPSAGPRSFREAWKEVSDKGMAVSDWFAGVVMLPKALRDSAGIPRASAMPGSPNVFRGWARAWGDIPECELKTEYLRELGRFAQAIDALAEENSADHRSKRRRKRGRPRAEKQSNSSYMDAYLDAFETGLRAVGDSSASGHEPTRARGRVPVPVPVLIGTDVPDQTADLRSRPIGSLPDPGGAPRVDRIQAADRSEVRSRGAAVPIAPLDPAAALRRSLVNAFVERVNSSRMRLAAELRLTGVRPIPLMGEGERALLERLRESTDPAADLDHVIAVAEVEVRKAKRELKWFGWSLAEPKAWRTLLASTLQEAKAASRDQRRPEPVGVPVLEQFRDQPPDIELTDDDRAELRALNERLIEGDYTSPEQDAE